MSGAAAPRRLGVLVDGAPMPEAEAVAFWDRFSLWMEEHRGDLAGFAAQEGFASVHPGVDGDRPVLRASNTAGQRPYAAVKEQGPGDTGGSGARQGGPRPPSRSGNNPRPFAKKRAR